MTSRLEIVSDSELDFCWLLCQENPGTWWWPASGNKSDFRALLWRDVLEMRLVVSRDHDLEGLCVAYGANLVHGRARLAVYLSPFAQRTGRPLRAVGQFIDLLFARYPLHKLSFESVTGTGPAWLTGASGFPAEEEALLRREVRLDGELRDVSVMAIFQETWSTRRSIGSSTSTVIDLLSSAGVDVAGADGSALLGELPGMDSLAIALISEQLAEFYALEWELTEHSTLRDLDSLLVEAQAASIASATVTDMVGIADRSGH